MSQTLLVKVLKWSKCKLDSADGIGVLGQMRSAVQVGDGFRFLSLEREVRHGWLLAADFLVYITEENTPASLLCLAYLVISLLSLQFSHDRGWDC